MKAILISDHAKWCALMMNGDKTIEVRKGTALYKAIQKLIDEYGFAEFYVYCTKDEKQGLVWDNNGKGLVNSKLFPYSKGSPEHNRLVNGKVIFKFRCYKVEELTWETENLVDKKLKGIHFIDDRDFAKTCLTYEEYESYLEKGKTGTAIHISNLEIFDEPKELNEFRHLHCDNFIKNVKVVQNAFGDYVTQYFNNERCSECKHYDSDCNDCLKSFKPLTKAPQSYMFIEVGENR